MNNRPKYIPVLTIAGSDSGGGAGIQADLKTFSALGCFGTTAITAVTVQNTLGVTAIHSIPNDIVVGQIRAVMDDIRPLAIKIGMIHRADLALAIAEVLQDYPNIQIVFDPVMVATSGDKLIEDDTIAVLQEKLFPLAALITPNLYEASLLADMPVKDVTDMRQAAKKLLSKGAHAILVKGGHLAEPILYDVYCNEDGNETLIQSKYIQTLNTHGTGCTLSSAITAFLAQDKPLSEAIHLGIKYVHEAIDAGKDIQTGSGHGSLNHFFNPLPLIIKYEMD
jgi:hydroxymethylpyrimidine/phosphomethylpyrimidine kinase